VAGEDILEKVTDLVDKTILLAKILLSGLMLISIFIGIVWIALELVVITKNPGLLTAELFKEFLNRFLLTLIAVELCLTVLAYVKDKTIYTHAVLGACIIAVGRKIILLDLEVHPPLTIIALALLLLVLAGVWKVTAR